MKTEMSVEQQMAVEYEYWTKAYAVRQREHDLNNEAFGSPRINFAWAQTVERAQRRQMSLSGSLIRQFREALDLDNYRKAIGA